MMAGAVGFVSPPVTSLWAEDPSAGNPVQAVIPARWTPVFGPRQTIDFAESRQADAWLHHVALGDPSFDSFQRRPGNPIVRGKPPFEWPVNGFLFEDPKSGNWYSYVGHYPSNYDIGRPDKPVPHCRVYRSKDRGKFWEEIGPIFNDPTFRFEGDTHAASHAPDVSVVFDGGRYHMAYDWATENTTWENVFHPSGGADSGVGYAWAERPEGPFHRALRPILCASQIPKRFAWSHKYLRAYATTLIRRANDWLVLTLTDSDRCYSWGLMAMTAADPAGPWSDPVLVLSVEGDHYYPAPVESFPAFVHEGRIYAPCTSVALNRNFQVVYRAAIETAHRPEAWELFQHGTAWHGEPVANEGFGIWGQTYSGFVDRQGALNVLFPSREVPSGVGTINLASRPWTKPLRERGFVLNGYEGTSLTLLRAAWRDFELDAQLTLHGQAARVLWGYQAPVGPDRHVSGASLHALALTRHHSIELSEKGWHASAVDAAGRVSSVASGKLEGGPSRHLVLAVQDDGQTRLAIDGKSCWQGQIPVATGAIGLLVQPHSNLAVERFAVTGEVRRLELPLLFIEALTGAGVAMDDWDVAQSPNYRYGVGAVRKTPGGRAKWNFRGRGFRLWSPKGPDFGRCEVLLNGKRFAELDLHRDRTESSQIVFTCEDAGDGYHAVVLNSIAGRLVIDSMDIIN